MQAWKSFEDRVRAIASLRWGVPCVPMHVHGVDFDGYLKISAEELIIIEITTDNTLRKVRDDISKIVPFRFARMAEHIFCRAFIVVDGVPTNSMREAAKESNVSLCSLEEFEREFFDFASYKTLRDLQPFGSAVDSKTGHNDQRDYISVRYSIDGNDNTFDVDGIARKLIGGSHIVLTGDYGSGKSRCVREIFNHLASKVTGAGAFPIAINLRDHWSSSNALEIIAGHLGNIGLKGSIDNMVRLLNAGGLVLLLDGFDEIGSQVYDPRANDRRSLRKHAVRGLRDLVIRAKAGILITGRSHFFDGDQEMLESLGVANSQKLVMARVPEHFSEAEASSYLDGLGVATLVPAWLPRKPLVFQLLAEIEKAEVERLLSHKLGQFEFWGSFFFAVCVRESKGVSESVSAETVRALLLDLAARSRYSNSFLGRLSPKEIDESYESVVRTMPDETGRLLLARLCTLGRIEPESPDRQFIDPVLVDVLRAEHLVSEASGMGESSLKSKWQQGLRVVGAVHAASLVDSYQVHHSFFAFVRKHAAALNSPILGEMVSILSLSEIDSLDFQGLNLIHSYVPVLNLHRKSIRNLSLKKTEIGVLDIDQTTVTSVSGLVIDDCIISAVFGISGQAGMPAWVTKTEVLEFDHLSNAALIKQSSMPAPNKLLLVIVHKIFFQRGSGREEASLRKGGYGQEYSSKLVGKILNLLLREEIVNRHKGNEGWIYTPVRSATSRMAKMKSELSLSADKIWKEVGLMTL